MRKIVQIIFISFFLLMATVSYGEEIYKVQKGDTLYSISKRYNVPIQELMAVNNLDSIALKMGQSLTIPQKNNTISKNEPSSNSKTQQPENVEILSTEIKSTAGKQPSFHIVKKGDTIYSIAKKNKLTVDELMNANNLNSNALKIGQKLSLKKQDVNLEFNFENDELDSIRSSYHKRKPPVINEKKINEALDLARAEDISNLDIQERIILFAKKLLHLPYTFGGSGAFGIDCSAFVQKVYKIAGISLPRSAREQFRHGELIDKNELEKGDLVFFRTYASFPSHVGIYLGNNLFIHASTLSKKVTIDSMDTPYYVKRYIGAKRLLTDEEIKNLDLPNLKNN